MPLSVLTAWVMEFRRWCPTWRLVRLHSADSKERERLRKEVLVDISKFDAVITTYEMILSQNMRYTLQHKLVWRYLVLHCHDFELLRSAAAVPGKGTSKLPA